MVNKIESLRLCALGSLPSGHSLPEIFLNRLRIAQSFELMLQRMRQGAAALFATPASIAAGYQFKIQTVFEHTGQSR